MRNARDKGAKRFALHTMVASNELNPDYFIETARMLFVLCAELKSRLGIRIEFVDLGGGIGIPYRPGQKAVDYDYVAAGIERVVQRDDQKARRPRSRWVFRSSAAVPLPDPMAGSLRRLSTKSTSTGTTSASTRAWPILMRPGMYGAYHHVSVAGKEKSPATKTYDVVGSLCENCDKFAVQRELPEIDIGDFVIVHDAGAHGRAMGFNYNAKLRAGELLLREDGSVVEIRRRETIDDYFATLDFSKLDSFK